jgi:L-amino acid N-acyltransferase YncA
MTLPLGPPAHPGGGLAVAVRSMTGDDAQAVLRIYQAGLDGGNASFETAAPSWAQFDAAKLPAHRFVAVATPVDAAGDVSGERGGAVLGWVAVVPVSARCVYAGVVEHSVYVDPAAQGRGVGRALLAALIDSTEAAGIWTIQSGIFPENVASLALHRGLGFRTVGVRERLGRHAARGGAWRDVVLLERRSPVVSGSAPAPAAGGQGLSKPAAVSTLAPSVEST